MPVRRWLTMALLGTAAGLYAQSAPPPPPHGPQRGVDRRQPGLNALAGAWWTNRQLVRELALSDGQLKRIDGVFQQHRQRLLELTSALRTQEARLGVLLGADRPDEAAVLAQVDRAAQARGELERANARMLVGFRVALTQEQWKRLQFEATRSVPPPPRPGGAARQ